MVAPEKGEERWPGCLIVKLPRGERVPVSVEGLTVKSSTTRACGRRPVDSAVVPTPSPGSDRLLHRAARSR